MSRHRFTRNLSANTLQLLLNQFFGAVIFFALSKGLSKEVFGEINWCLAVLLTGFSLLGMGMDQIVIKKVAAGYNRQAIAQIYLFHVCCTGLAFCFIIALIYLFAPALFPGHSMLLLLAVGKLAIFLSTPMKQVATGLEKFNLLLFMSVTSNLLRGLALTLLWIGHFMTPPLVILIFIAGDLLELFVSLLITRPLASYRYSLKLRTARYRYLIKESLPQAGVVVCTALMARFSWILMGILGSGTALAEYSFAWKAFEMSTLPLLVVAPLMIPLFTRLRQNNETIKQLSFFLRWQLMTACLAALALNTAWNPLIDMVTDRKYGQVNTNTIFILSLSMPLLYCNNYLWTIAFALGRLKQIFIIMVVSLCVNIATCSALIPFFHGEGAAIANFLTVSVQLILYIKYCEIRFPISLWIELLAWPALAFAAGFFANQLFGSSLISFSLAIGTYCLMVILSGKLRRSDWKTLQIFYQ